MTEEQTNKAFQHIQPEK